MRFGAPGERPDGLVVDLLFASSGIEPEIVAEAVTLEVLPNLLLPVARVGHLIALKILAARARDPEDVEHLLAIADRTEIDRAHLALRAIAERDYDRGQDLEGTLQRLLAISDETSAE